VKATRSRPEFVFLQPTLVKPSATASDVERLEHWLLSLDDETFDTMTTRPEIAIRDNAPSATGDEVGDRWEREFWASRGAK